LDNVAASNNVTQTAFAEPHWMYQGRQAHGYFGSGTGPGRDISGSATETADLFSPAGVGQRVGYAARSLFVHLHHSDVEHPVAKFNPVTIRDLKTVVAAWYGARSLSRDAFRARLLHPAMQDSTVDYLRAAARGIVEARTPAVLNAANANLAAAVRRIGLDNWPFFLSDAQKRAVRAVTDNQLPGVIKVGSADAAVMGPGLLTLGLLMLLMPGKGRTPAKPVAPVPPVVVHQDTPDDGSKKETADKPPPPTVATPAAPPQGVVIPDDTRKHILDTHGPGRGVPNKSEFPKGWSDDKIIEAIREVAEDPSSTRSTGNSGRTLVNGSVDGVDIQVVIGRDGRTVATAYPTNTPRNPPKTP
jgi:hypothetical protein